MNLKELHSKIDILIKQVNDLEMLRKYPDLKNSNVHELKMMYVRTLLNFKQRERFIAFTYAKNSQDALIRLFEIERKNEI